MVKFIINKPIAVLMTTLGILILGIYALNFIPISLMPDIDIPEITVQVSAKNMSVRQIEDVVVKPLRRNLQQLNNLKDIRSEATNETATIKLTFNHGTKIDYAFIEVNDKIDRSMGSFPKTMKRPKVIKASATDIPVFYLSMTLKHDKPLIGNESSNKISQDFIEFNRFVNQVIKKRIEQVSEVAMVDISGVIYSEIVIIPDNKKLTALNISLDELESNIKKYNVKIGNLLIKDNQYQYDVTLGSELNNIQEIQNIYIHKNNRVYQLKELAHIIEQPQKRMGLVLSDNRDAVVMSIIKQSDARMGNLKKSLNQQLAYFKKDYPNIDFTITQDQTKLLDYTISNLYQSLLWGVLFAFGIMFLFLKDVKSPLLIGITIPISIIICLLLFKLLGISINIISLSGLVLGIGLMIDNSIIVIDNITQFREKKLSLIVSCVQGTNEIIRPLLSSALTTCAIFVPLVFISGMGGALFYDQAMAISIGLFSSFFVSITLLPVLYRLFYLKNREDKQGTISKFLTKINRLDYAKLYEKGFKWVMRHQHISLGVCVVLLLVTVGLYAFLPKTQMPYFTKTETLLHIDWNKQIHVDENKKRVLTLLNPINNLLVHNTALVGKQQFLLDRTANTKSSESVLYLQCKTPQALQKTIRVLTNKINKTFPNCLYTFKDVDNIFNMIFPNDVPLLVAELKNVEHTGSNQNTKLEKIWHHFQQNFPELVITPIAWQDYINLVVNQNKLITYNVNSDQVFNNLKSAFNEREILSITDNQNFVPIILGEVDKGLSDILNETVVISRDSTVFNLNNFVREVLLKDLKTIRGGKDGEYYPIALFVEDDVVDKTVSKVKKIVSEHPSYNVSFSGSYFANKQLIQELIIILLIALALLYFILASQFESLLLPLIILLEVPFDLAGAFLFLKLFGMSINLMSMIGIIVMCGIVINDSILKIATILQLQQEGYSLLRALSVAGQRRLKPILMTSLTTILALTPILFSDGLGAELQAPLAIALIGGMLVGTLVSLYFIPLSFYHIQKIK